MTPLPDPLPDPKEVAESSIQKALTDCAVKMYDECRVGPVVEPDLLPYIESNIESALRARDEWWKAQVDEEKVRANKFEGALQSANVTAKRRGEWSKTYAATADDLMEQLEAAQAQQAEIVKALEEIRCWVGHQTSGRRKV